MGPPKSQSQNYKHNLKQVGKIPNPFSSDDTLLYCHNATDMLLLTDKLTFMCYALHETK